MAMRGEGGEGQAIAGGQGGRGHGCRRQGGKGAGRRGAGRRGAGRRGAGRLGAGRQEGRALGGQGGDLGRRPRSFHPPPSP